MYVKTAFIPEAKARMDALIDNLTAAFRERISTVEWMGEETRKEALAKLASFTRKIGYPEKWESYAGLEITPGTYLDNSLKVTAYEIDRNLRKIGKPVDRSEWFLTASTLNAYYYPPNNEIVFPAGILQPPMFDAKADDAMNYGAIGAVIGHELSHGFDDKGSTFNSRGNLRNWWTDADRKNFTDRAACIERQFAAYEVEKGLNINGKLTLGENIGDLGGVNMALAAYRKSLAGKPRPPVIGLHARATLLHRLRAGVGGERATGVRAALHEHQRPRLAALPCQRAAVEHPRVRRRFRMQTRRRDGAGGERPLPGLVIAELRKP